MEYYEVEKVPDDVFEKFQKILTVLEVEAQIAKEIQYKYPIRFEGYLYSGKNVGIYAFPGEFNEIETYLTSYSRMIVPELQYDVEDFAEDWQRLQLIVEEIDDIIESLEEIKKYVKLATPENFMKAIEEVKRVKDKSVIENIKYGRLF